MNARQYELVASIVNGLPPEIKAVVADHFARGFHKAYPTFDVCAWEDRTGGTLKRADVESEEQRKARVEAYVANVLGRSTPTSAGGRETQ